MNNSQKILDGKTQNSPLAKNACALCQFALLPVSGSARTRGMDSPKDAKVEMHSEEFLHRLMRRQLRLSIACAATFLAALLGLPLLNYFLPDLMATRVFGFTLTWFILGVLFFPLVWAIAWVFIRRSIALEDAEAAEVEAKKSAEGEREKRGKGAEENSGI